MGAKTKRREDALEPPASASQELRVQASTVNLVFPSKEDEPYDPFSQRPAGLQYSDFGAWAHMVKSGMGTGIMSMPMAFKYGGLVLGLVGTPIIGLLCGHCVLLLVGTAQRLYVRARVPAMTMDQVAFYAFLYGPPRARRFAVAARTFAQAALFTTYFFVTISYAIFIGDALEQLVTQWDPSVSLEKWVYIAPMAVVFLPLGQIRHLRTLVPFSVLANLCIVVGFAITLYYLLDRAPDMDKLSVGPSLIGLPIFFATALYSMEGIGTVMPVENTMRNPAHLGGWTGIASRAMAFVVTLFTLIGVLGYLRFGEAVLASITLNLDKQLVPAQVVKALLVAAITFTYPLQFYVVCELLEPMLQGRITSPKNYSWVQVGLRLVLVALSLLLACAVPDLQLVISLMGAVLFSTIGLLIPAVSHLVFELGIMSEEQHSSGWRKLTVTKDALLVTLSVVFAVLGVYSTLASMT